MIYPKKSLFISALLLCSALNLTIVQANDSDSSSSDYPTPWQPMMDSPFSFDSSMSEEEPSASELTGNNADLLKTLLGKIGEASLSPSDALINTIKPYIPLVYRINFHSPMTNEGGGHMGTGFLLDAKEGIIATNYHVVPGNLPGQITVVTDEGEEYTSPEVEILSPSVGYQFGDFSLLRVKKLATDKPEAQMPISTVFDAEKHDLLGFMGNSYGSFTVEVGGLNDRYHYWDTVETRGSMSVSVNLNARGGASGSPVFNQNGEVVGILFAGDEVHNMILPIRYVMDAYEQVKMGERVTAVSLGSPLVSEKIHRLSLFHRIPVDTLREYVASKDQELKLMVAKPITVNLQKGDTLQPNDILLTVDEELVGTDQLRMNELLRYAPTHKVRVYRNGELKDLTIQTQTYTQSFVRSIDIDDMTVISADSTLLDRYGLTPDTPLIKTPGLEILGISADFSIISQVHKTKVSTFNEFIHALIDTFDTQKLETFFIFTKGVTADTPDTVEVDLRGAHGKSLYVTLMDETTHQWKNVDYKEYGIQVNATNDDLEAVPDRPKRASDQITGGDTFQNTSNKRPRRK